MNFLRQSTAVDVLIGPFVDSTDGDTEETGLTISASDVLLSKNGQTLAAKNDATACAHDANGMYNCEFDTTDTNTVGTLVLFVHESGALAVRHEFQVLEEDVYDALFGASAAGFDSNGRVDVGSWLGTAVTTSSTTSKPEVDAFSISDDATAANNLELDYDGTGYAKANSTIGTCTTNTDMRGTDSAATAADLATVDTVVDAIKVVTDALGATAAASLALSLGSSPTFTISDAVSSPTATVFAADDITEATADHYKGRNILFTTGALAGQMSDITAYSLASGEGNFTVTALTEAPANTDTGIIL